MPETHAEKWLALIAHIGKRPTVSSLPFSESARGAVRGTIRGWKGQIDGNECTVGGDVRTVEADVRALQRGARTMDRTLFQTERRGLSTGSRFAAKCYRGRSNDTDVPTTDDNDGPIGIDGCFIDDTGTNAHANARGIDVAVRTIDVDLRSTEGGLRATDS